MSTVMSNVSIRDLEIQLGSHTIIESLDLEVEPGEFLVLLGPSGCGKSTLLHSIAGLIDVSGGSIEIGGQDMTWADPKDRGIALVFQSFALFPWETVYENIALALKPLHRAPGEVKVSGKSGAVPRAREYQQGFRTDTVEIHVLHPPRKVWRAYSHGPHGSTVGRVIEPPTRSGVTRATGNPPAPGAA